MPEKDGPSLEMPSFGFRRRRQAAAAPESEAPPPEPAPEPEAEPEPTGTSDGSEEAAGARKASRGVSLPTIGGRTASTVAGLVVGSVLVGLVWASLRLCEVVRGTSSCGRPGFLVLLAILVVLVIVGRALLNGLGVADPGSTSFLGVGVVAVVVLLVLSDQLFAWWAALVVPAVAAASFLLAHWVSTAFVETPEGNLHR